MHGELLLTQYTPMAPSALLWYIASAKHILHLPKSIQLLDRLTALIQSLCHHDLEFKDHWIDRSGRNIFISKSACSHTKSPKQMFDVENWNTLSPFTWGSQNNFSLFFKCLPHVLSLKTEIKLRNKAQLHREWDFCDTYFALNLHDCPD